MKITDITTILTIIASVSAAVFFIWKIIAGWLVVNVEISIEIDRQAQTEKEDLLAFKIIFKKGNTDTLQIKDIQARVSYQQNGEQKQQVEMFPEINKLSINDKKIMNWKTLDAKGRKISLSPGESFHVGRFVWIPTATPVIVEAILHGTRKFWKRGFQWHASIASLPVIKKDSDKK